VTAVSSHARDVGAQVVTQASTPALVNLAVSVALGLRAGDLPAGLAVGLMSGPVPFLFIVAGVRRTRFSDVHVRVREQRPKLIAAILVGLTMTLAGLLAFRASREVSALCAAMLVTLVAVGVVTTAGQWKVSVHAAVLAGSVVMLSISGPPLWLAAFATLPAVMWSRVHLGAHTTPQVTAGAVLGLVVAGTTFLLVR